jgi:hypothetical protein
MEDNAINPQHEHNKREREAIKKSIHRAKLKAIESPEEAKIRKEKEAMHKAEKRAMETPGKAQVRRERSQEEW